jgi:hypothetical protein
MKALFRTLLLLTLLALPSFGWAHGPAGGFQITKIDKNLITAPQYSYIGGEQITTNQRDLWLSIDTEFTSTLEVADDVVFKYFVLIGGKVLTGEVTHTNILAGRGLRSVMFAPPKVLARFNGGRPLVAASIQNIAVQIVQQGAVKEQANLSRASAGWYTSLPQVPGFLLNKNDTPFAPLYWDRYEQIKPAH